MVARGGMVIWVPSVFQGEKISELLITILPSADAFAATQVVALIQFATPLLVGLTLFDAFSYANDRHDVKLGLSPEWQHRIRLAGFAILFATASPLISFGVYFCGWHSIRGLIHLHQQFGGTIGQFSLSLLPITGAAFVMFGIGFAISLNYGQLIPAIIQTVFIGLSAVAIPHLLLHVVSDSMAARTKIAGVPA
jgi:Brp/Blh family beta-carotene 15,15'-monooxygenase